MKIFVKWCKSATYRHFHALFRTQNFCAWICYINAKAIKKTRDFAFAFFVRNLWHGQSKRCTHFLTTEIVLAHVSSWNQRRSWCCLTRAEISLGFAFRQCHSVISQWRLWNRIYHRSWSNICDWVTLRTRINLVSLWSFFPFFKGD